MNPTFMTVARLDEIQEDEPFGIELMDTQIALFRIGDDVFATDNVCPHQYALLSDGYLEDGCIECPLHQARFDVRTGAALCGPVERGLRTFAVRVEDGQVRVALDAS